MTLGDAERSALVAHLASRFPSWGARADVARDAGLGDVQLTGPARQAWEVLVREAEERDVLVDLLRTVARAHATDEVLAGLHASAAAGRLVVPPPDDPAAWIRGAAIAGGVVLLFGALALIGDLTGLSAGWIADAPPPSPTPAVLPDAVAEPPAEPANDPPTQAEPADTTPRVESLPVPPERPLAAPSDPVTPGASDGPCATPAGELVGYAYAGSSSPGQAGETWVLPRSLNVRVDYPRQENGWSSKARVACVLNKGVRLRLRDAPIPVGGGVFWVPVVGGAATRP